jgi:hypothetical protein
MAMATARMRRILGLGAVAACISFWQPLPGWAQKVHDGSAQSQTVLTVEQPDAQRTREELAHLLEHYPPALRNVLALDPSLVSNQSYVAPYPGLVNFLNAHPEIARNPSFYFGEVFPRANPDPVERAMDMWRDVLAGLAALTGFGMGIGLVIWLIRTLVDFKRWSRLAKVQTDAHTKILDRFTANDDLLAYVQSPAGAKFLQSSPIMLDAGPRAVGAPLSRILWSVQGGVVLIAGGIGLQAVSSRVSDVSSQPLHALGVLAIALGLGFLVSAIISFVISQRLGLIDPASRAPRADMPSA